MSKRKRARNTLVFRHVKDRQGNKQTLEVDGEDYHVVDDILRSVRENARDSNEINKCSTAQFLLQGVSTISESRRVRRFSLGNVWADDATNLSLSEAVGELDDLEVIQLFETSVLTLPDEIGNLSNLTMLTINCCIESTEVTWNGKLYDGEYDFLLPEKTSVVDMVDSLQYLRGWSSLRNLEIRLNFLYIEDEDEYPEDLILGEKTFPLHIDFLRPLTNLKSLYLRNLHEGVFPRIKLSELAHLRLIEELEIWYCAWVVNDIDTNFNIDFPNRRRLRLTSTNPYGALLAMSHLNMPYLEELSMDNCELRNDHLIRFADLLKSCPQVNSRSFESNWYISRLPSNLSNKIQRLMLRGTGLQTVPCQKLLAFVKENEENLVDVGCIVHNTDFNHFIGINNARKRVLQDQRILPFLWAFLLAHPTDVFKMPKYSETLSREKPTAYQFLAGAQTSNTDAIFHLLKNRAAYALFSPPYRTCQQDASRWAKPACTGNRKGHRTPILHTAYLLLCTIACFLSIASGFVTQPTNTLRSLTSTNMVKTKLFEKILRRSTSMQETPHAGRHFLPAHPAYSRPWPRRLFWKRRRRFMEGWYYRLTLTDSNVSFAFILSIEDPGIHTSGLTLACIQVVGPDDTYLVQASKDDTKFWASRKTQALGNTFEYNDPELEETFRIQTELAVDEWKKSVKSGFQVLPDRLLGRVNGHDGSQGGVLEGQGVAGHCEFDLTVKPICGWGSYASNQNQKSTGGWLSSFPIFEPHWQVTMADARARGFVEWNGTRYAFDDEPFYAEKNWGKALPSKWYWTQCNSFEGYDQLSVTAGGGIRKLPFAQKEALGMISVHYNGTFYEAVPWLGSMDWNVSTWGYWGMSGECLDTKNPFAVEVTYELDPEELPGLVFRAPTPDEGMVYFCRDTFEANCTLSLWELEEYTDVFATKKGKQYRRKEPPIIDRAFSRQGGAEIGGGPWWNEWKAKSKLKRVIKSLLNVSNKVSRR